MNGCPEFEERLHDLLDGLLAPPEREKTERHLRECAGCRESLAALRSLRERTAALPRSLEPDRDLWPGIRDALPPRRGGAFVRSFLRRHGAAGAATGRRPRFALAGAAAVAAILLAIFVVAHRDRARWILQVPGAGEAPVAGRLPAESAPPGKTGSPAETAAATSPALSSLALLEAAYQGPTEQLQSALAAFLMEHSGGRRGEGAAGAVGVIEANLRIVDGAIREVRRVAEEDPGRAVEEQMVTNLYRTRFELLRQAVSLASREGEEKQS